MKKNFDREASYTHISNAEIGRLPEDFLNLVEQLQWDVLSTREDVQEHVQRLFAIVFNTKNTYEKQGYELLQALYGTREKTLEVLAREYEESVPKLKRLVRSYKIELAEIVTTSRSKNALYRHLERSTAWKQGQKY